MIYIILLHFPRFFFFFDFFSAIALHLCWQLYLAFSPALWCHYR